MNVPSIIFNKTHFMRDPARDGSTLVSSDLEQVPTVGENAPGGQAEGCAPVCPG